jgi:hypothetical protein
MALGIVVGGAACKAENSPPERFDAAQSAAEDSSADNAQPRADQENRDESYDPCDCSNSGACPTPWEFEHSNCESIPIGNSQGTVWRASYGQNCWAFEEQIGDIFVALFYEGPWNTSSPLVAKRWKNVSPAQVPLSSIGIGSGTCGVPCGSTEISQEFVCGYHD